MPPITCRVTAATINRIGDELGALSKRVKNLTPAIAEELARYGAEAAQERFDAAAPSYPGVYNVKVEATQTKNGSWSIKAKGNAASFIEYGTGVLNENGEGRDDIWAFPVRRGLPPPSDLDGESYWRHPLRRRAVWDPSFAGQWKSTEEEKYKHRYGVKGKRLDGYTYTPDEKIAITKGSPANWCMENAFTDVIDYFEEIRDDYAEEIKG